MNHPPKAINPSQLIIITCLGASESNSSKNRMQGRADCALKEEGMGIQS